MANEYLQRTPTSTGNNKVFTWSGWVKRSIFSANYAGSQNLFRATGGSGGDCGWRFDYTTPNDSLRLFLAGAAEGNVQADGKSRDPGNWMHVMLAFNTTLEQDSARVRIYVNGALTPDNNTGYPNKNFQTSFNEIITQYIGAYNGSSEFFNGEMFDVFMVDGQALTPDVFGFYKNGDGYISAGSTQATDFRPGQWVPKSPSVIKNVIDNNGGFGVNGFYLPMNDSSNPGADFHCDPNSIITLKGEDLPQPRNGAPTTSDAYVSQLRSDPNAANLVLAVPGASTATGANLVTNGNFDTNTTGWTAFNSATLSVDSGRLKVTNGTSSAGYAYQEITVVIGQRYTVNLEGITGTSASNIRIGTAANGADYGNKIGSGLANISLTATSTSLFVTLKPNSNTNGNNALFDNVVVKQEDAPRDYSANIKGSGTNKTLTANGNAGVGYELGNYYGSAMTFDGTGDYLSITSNTDFALGTGDFTVECWVKFDALTGISDLLSSGTQTGGWALYASTLQVGFVAQNIEAISGQNLTTDQWIHIAAERYGTTVTIYVNGVASTIDTSFAHDITQNGFAIGAQTTGSDDTDGQIQDVRVYKGVAKYKGGFDVPKPYTPVGIESWRATTDTCSNNFATLNAVDYNSSTTALSDGNLTMNATSNNGSAYSATYNVPNSGKYYFEFYEKVIDVTTTNYISIVSIVDSSKYQQYRGYGQIYTDGVQATGFTTMDEGDLVGVAIDADNGTVSFYNNGTLVSTVTSSNVDYVRNSRIQSYLPRGAGSYPPGDTRVFNFGQNPSFSGALTAGTNADDSGKGLFKYAPPSGFLALCEDNLPAPAIADPGDYMRTVLWTGSGSARNVNGVGFKPDFVWMKGRSGSSYNHILNDSVRGPRKTLFTNHTLAEYTDRGVSSFDDDGFSLIGGSGSDENATNVPYVAWCWKAGGAAVSNSDGSITSQVSANQTAGFSIVSYTGTGANATVGHGLGKAPSFMIVKNRDSALNWAIWHSAIAGNQYFRFTTNAVTDLGTVWNSSIPTSSIINLGSSIATNESTSRFIAYCWAEIEGYSKFGSFSGNSSTDGVFVYTGFRPAWVMIKRTDSTDSWAIFDSSRDSINPVERLLRAESSNAEATMTSLVSNPFGDLLSNGFKVRNTSTIDNVGSYVFAAFAESPFKYANSK